MTFSQAKQDAAELIAILDFYANPFHRKDESDEFITVPDFYSELCFGDSAEHALTFARTLPALIERAETAQNEVSRLQGILTALQKGTEPSRSKYREENRELRAQRNAALCRVRDLEGALEPFAKALDAIERRYGSDNDDRQPTNGMSAEFNFTIGQFRRARAALASNPPAPTNKETNMTEEQIKHMVRRFLTWQLPENFKPDAGISFKAEFNENTAYPMKHTPSGTNLFDAVQADVMVRYMIDGMPAPVSSDRTVLTRADQEAFARVIDGDALTPSLKIEVSKEWCEQAAQAEGDAEIGAGLLAMDPAPVTDDEVNRLREELADAYKKLSGKDHHASDCATSNAPAMPPGPCDCDAPVTEMLIFQDWFRRKVERDPDIDSDAGAAPAHEQAMVDAANYGTGFVHMDTSGNSRAIPPDEVLVPALVIDWRALAERLAEALDHVTSDLGPKHGAGALREAEARKELARAARAEFNRAKEGDHG